MKKTEIKKLLKQIGEYKKWTLSNNDPFGYQNAYWAAGFEYFLNYLATSQKDLTNI